MKKSNYLNEVLKSFGDITYDFDPHTFQDAIDSLIAGDLVIEMEEPES